ERVNWAILRAMSADAEQRPRSCREFIEDLTGHSTRRTATVSTASATVQDLWYLVYRDEVGAQHTVKGTTAAIRRSFRDGLLGDAENLLASRTKAGPFLALRQFPEFRDMLVNAAPMPVAPVSPSRATEAAATRPGYKEATVTPPSGAALKAPSTTQVPHIA